MFITKRTRNARPTSTSARMAVLVGGTVAAATFGFAAHQASAGGVDMKPSATTAPGDPQLPQDPGIPQTAPVTTVPIITLPPGVTIAPPSIPVITLPPGVTIAPPSTDPIITLPPGVTIVPTVPETTEPATDPEPGDTTPPADPSDPTVPANGGDSGDVVGAWEPEELSLDITLAEVACDGTVHVEYETVALPEPGWTADHIVMVNPVADPTAIQAMEMSDNPANGEFVFDHPGVPTETYRVLVVGLFDPENTDGVKLVAEAEAVLADGC